MPPDGWAAHRRLIRATLPKSRRQRAAARPIPEFTMHQRPPSRGFHGAGSATAAPARATAGIRAITVSARITATARRSATVMVRTAIAPCSLAEASQAAGAAAVAAAASVLLRDRPHSSQ
jgi:hypothetical protein